MFRHFFATSDRPYDRIAIAAAWDSVRAPLEMVFDA
jgi:hypothetical protein